MRYPTAVRRLRTIAERCAQTSGLWDEEPMLLGTYAFGAVLDNPDALDVVQIALVLNLPTTELTWGARPQSCSSLPRLLEIDNAPVDWHWRPKAWPVTNHRIRRPLRIWSSDGVNEEALEALAQRRAEALRPPAPSPHAERAQLAIELDACLDYLRTIEGHYWQPEWRRENRGFGIYPEHHMWDAVHGYLDLLQAVEAQDLA